MADVLEDIPEDSEDFEGKKRRRSSIFESSENLPKPGFLNPAELAPDTILYRTPSARPKMSDIRKLSFRYNNNQLEETIVPHFPEIPEELKKEPRGWFAGVFVPTLINLLCVTYFVDIPATIDEVGLGYGLIFLCIFQLIAYGTLTNICAIATNGEMKDGGCYYLISRTLGANFAGAVGIVLIVAHSTAVSTRFYYLSHLITGFYDPKTFTNSNSNDVTVLQVCLCAVTFFFGLLGFKAMTYLLIVLGIALALGVFSIYAGFISIDPSPTGFFAGFSAGMLRKNWGTENKTISLLEIGNLLSSTNGIMTVADFSGNLNPPQQAIPIGGFSSLITSTVLFFLLLFLIAASGNFDFWSKAKLTLFKISAVPILSNIGFIAACFGSALTMSSGGARITKMMIEDNLLPQWLNLFTINGESFGSHLLVIVIAMLFSMINTPTIALQITNISFLLPLALSNWCVYTCASAHYPGFRPTFKLYNKWFALFLTLLCIVRAFFIQWYFALIFLIIFSCIYFAYQRFHLVHDKWGSVLSSHTFYSTMKEAIELYQIPPHVKTYRSNIILATTKTPDEARPAIDILNQLLHRHGMACIGQVIITIEKQDIRRLMKMREKTFLTDDDGYRTFFDVTIASTFQEGVRDLLLQVGIGVMRPNTLCLEFPDDWKQTDYMDFISSINVAFDANYAVTILRHVNEFKTVPHDGTIDVWWLSDDGGLTLLLPYLLSKQRLWKKSKLRIMTIAFVDDGDIFEETQEKMQHLLYKFRITAEVITIDVSLASEIPSPMSYTLWRQLVGTSSRNGDIDQLTHRYLVLSDLIRQYSSASSAIALTMVVPHDTTDPLIYLAWLDVMSHINIPFFFIRGNGDNTLSWNV